MEEVKTPEEVPALIQKEFRPLGEAETVSNTEAPGRVRPEISGIRAPAHGLCGRFPHGLSAPGGETAALVIGVPPVVRALRGVLFHHNASH